MRNQAAGIYDWNNHQAAVEPVRQPSDQVEIDDETWRDGMQGTHVETHPATEAKEIYIDQLSTLGYADHLDIGFPATGVLHRNEIIHLINSSYAKNHKLTFSVAGRGAAVDDARAILEVSQKTGRTLEADLFLDGSTLRAELEGWDKAEMIKQLKRNIIHLKKEGLLVMFVPERASATSPEELFELCTAAADSGADRIAIADTTGVLTPYGTSNIFRETFTQLGKKYPNLKFDFHEHEDLGMGLANCVVAAKEGVDRLHATARGVGERAGNVHLERLLIVLHLQGFRDVNTREIQKFAKLAADILSVPIADHEPIVGAQATETASGVHAHTYQKGIKGKGAHIYLPYNPEDIGQTPGVRIGPMSGLSNVYAYCKFLGMGAITEECALEVLSLAKEKWGLLPESVVRDVAGRNARREEG